jgi:hypothetical protein
MIPLLACSEAELPKRAAAIGASDYGQFLAPVSGHRLASGVRFAVDNGGFTRADPEGFLRQVDAVRSEMSRCLFVVVPDVVADARRTLEVFDVWSRMEKMKGLPLAFVLQDGIENLSIPWDRIYAAFVGGTTEWKMGSHAASCIKAAKWLGKWVHVGRVSTAQRWEHFARLGADSADGSMLGRAFPDSEKRWADLSAAIAGNWPPTNTQASGARAAVQPSLFGDGPGDAEPADAE